MRALKGSILANRTRETRTRRVPPVQMREVADVVDRERPARAALVPRFPGLSGRSCARVEDEVIHAELTVAVEQIEQARIVVRALEYVLLVDLDHRQPATFSVQRVPVTREFLLLGEQLLARNKLFVSRYDFRMFHVALCHDDFSLYAVMFNSGLGQVVGEMVQALVPAL
jgi:hypothetical protein